MAVVGDKIYYISDERVYETTSDSVVFEEFPVSRIAAAGDTFAVFGGGVVKIGEDSYTLPVSEITSLVCVGNTIGSLRSCHVRRQRHRRKLRLSSRFT